MAMVRWYDIDIVPAHCCFLKCFVCVRSMQIDVVGYFGGGDSRFSKKCALARDFSRGDFPFPPFSPSPPLFLFGDGIQNRTVKAEKPIHLKRNRSMLMPGERGRRRAYQHSIVNHHVHEQSSFHEGPVGHSRQQ